MKANLEEIYNEIETNNDIIIEALDITEEKIEGKSEKEICSIIHINITKKPKLLYFKETYLLLNYFRDNIYYIDQPLVIELSKIVNELDYKNRLVLNKRDKDDENTLKLKINLLHFFVTFILIDFHYVEYFLPFLSETINFLNNKDEKDFILLVLKNEPDFIDKFNEIYKQLKNYSLRYTELRETRIRTIVPELSGILEEISAIIKINIDVEEDYDYSYLDDEKLFDSLCTKLNENMNYYENNEILKYREIKCQNLKEKKQKIFILENKIRAIYQINENINNGLYDVKDKTIGENEDITNVIFSINRKIYLCRFVI